MIFDVKQDGCTKATLVIGGHVLDVDDMDTYSLVMKTILVQLIMVIAKANNYQVLTRDVKNPYLYADCDINICTWVGPEFELAGFENGVCGKGRKGSLWSAIKWTELTFSFGRDITDPGIQTCKV